MPFAQKSPCIYCGATASSTADHIPPKNLFPKPRPSNLISVPACDDCNHGFSKDDEYFRLALTSRRDLEDQPAVKRLNDEVLSGLSRPESEGFRQSFFNSTRTVDEVLADGTLRPKMQFQRDFDRLSKVALRIVKGLFYHEFKGIMPSGRMDVFDDVGFAFDSMQPIFPLQSVLKTLREEPVRIIHEEVFEYCFASVDGAPETIVWQLTFFRRAWFLVLTNWEQFRSVR